MAKELHIWGRYILLAIVIIFGTGGWVVTVRSNTNDIGKLQEKTEILQEDVHVLELNNKDLTNISKNTLNVLVQVNAKLETITKTQTDQAVIQAVNSTKLESLTKD